MKYEEGVRKLIDISKDISELYRQMNEIIAHLKECNKESIRFDPLYIKELLYKNTWLTEVYDTMLVHICINECFDMKSWLAGEYTFDMEEIESWVADFNHRHAASIKTEEVLKSMQFEYGVDLALSRSGRA
ncbi:hypothetical protein J7Q84_04940 [Bacillus sp. 165]|nr:hypothetical protein [Bacillus sp. 165]